MQTLTQELLQIMVVPEELKVKAILPENLHQGPTREELRYLDKELALQLDDELSSEELDEAFEMDLYEEFGTAGDDHAELNFD